MQFIDILRIQNLGMFIQVEELWRDHTGKTQSKRSGIMKVGNMKWEKIRHFEYKNVLRIIPCERNGIKYLFVQVDDSEKNFYDRR